MSKEVELLDDEPSSRERLEEADQEDPLSRSDRLISQEIPHGMVRRTFLMRSAVVGATALITGHNISAQQRTERATGAPLIATGTPTKLDSSLNVVKQAKGPVMTTLDEFYKVGPGPSSSHTIGPMRITYDFY